MKTTAKGWLYWLSPLIAVVIPTVVFFVMTWYYAQPGNMGAERPVVYFDTFSGYSIFLLVFLLFSYLYLAVFKRYVKYHRVVVAWSVVVIVVGSIWFGNSFFFEGKALTDRIVLVPAVLIWTLICFTPIYMASNLYLESLDKAEEKARQKETALKVPPVL